MRMEAIPGGEEARGVTGNIFTDGGDGRGPGPFLFLAPMSLCCELTPDPAAGCAEATRRTAWVCRKRHHLVKDLLNVGRDGLRSRAEAEGLSKRLRLGIP